MSAVGIDFGNQSCYVAIARQGGIETVNNDYSDRTTPSLVSFGAKQRILGAAAKNQVVTNARNTVALFKNLLGRTFSDPYVQELRKRLSYELVERDGDKIGIKVNYLGEDCVFSPEQVTAMLLSQLKKTTEDAIGSKVTDVVVSVPSYFTDPQRRAFLDAVETAGLNCLRLMNDTTASALTYGIYKQDLPAETEPPRHVVFVDLGYTSLQVALCAFNKGKVEVKAKAFDPCLGGGDFDWRLMEHFAKEFKEKYKIDCLSSVRPRLRLMTECEKLKKLMSANNTVIPLNIECFMDDKDVTGRLQRADFEAMCADLLARVKAPLQAVLDQAGLKKEDIYSVEIIGGNTRMPAVKDIISEVYGKFVSTTLNQDEAVARGCALQSAILSPTFRVRDFNVTDRQPYGIKLSWVREDNQETGDVVLFQPNSQINFSKVLVMYRKESFGINASYANPECTPTGNPAIGQFTVAGVVPTASGEASKLKVKARLNIHGVFNIVTATLYEKLPEPVEPEGNGKEKEVEGMDNKGSENAPEDMEKSSGAGVEGTDTSQRQDSQDADSLMEAEGQGEAGAPKEEGKESSQPQEQEQKAAAEGETQPPEDPSAKNGSQSSADKESVAKKKRKTVKAIDLPVSAFTSSASREQLDHAREEEGKMLAHDRLEADRAVARNAVEEYVYDMRDKLEDQLQEYISQEDKEPLVKLLNDTEDWLYGEGEDETKTVYQDRLAQLKKLGDPVVERYRQDLGRVPAFDALGQAIVHFEKILELYQQGVELYNHIEAEEMKKVEREVQVKRTWLTEKMQAQEKLPKCANPAVTVAQIGTEKGALESLCNPIVNKPKPKVEPPKDDKKDAADEKEKEKKDKEEEGGAKEEDKQPAAGGEAGAEGAAQNDTSTADPMDVD